MSITITRVPDGNDVWGRTQIQYRDITLDTSYPLTAGYVINAQDVGLKSIFGATVVSGNKAAGALNFAFDFGTVAGDLKTAVALRAFFPTGGGSTPATLTAPAAGVTEGAITVTNGAITVTNGAITAGANTVGGSATATVPAGGTTVTSTSAQPAIPVALGSVTVTSANPTQATTTASQATTTASIAAGSGALTAGLGKEVGDTTDMSSIIVRVRFEGR